MIGKAELQKREAEVLQNATEVASLRAQLRGLGMSEASIQRLESTRKLNSEYPIIASIAGTVIERKVTIGQVIQPADPAFIVADLSNLGSSQMLRNSTQAPSQLERPSSLPYLHYRGSDHGATFLRQSSCQS